MIVEIENVSRQYRDGSREIHALSDVNLQIATGETVALLGESGSGKSTLLHLMGGVEHPSHGEIRIRGQALGGMNDEALTGFRLRNIGFVFQFFHLLPTLSVRENLMLPTELAGLPRKTGMQRATELLSAVNLAQRIDTYPDKLSGGEQQRVAIARGLMLEPTLVLADEPTGNLDSDNGEQVLDLLLDLTLTRDTTLIVATHSEEIAARMRRRIELRDGRVIGDSGAPATSSATPPAGPSS